MEDFINWGGDGSDLSEPVRAHVAAALLVSDESYPPPLDQLLVIEDYAQQITRDEDYPARVGIGSEHIAALICMARDRALHAADRNDPRALAPFYALDVLEHIGLGEHAADLIPLLDIDDIDLSEQVADLLEEWGAPAIDELLAYLNDRTRWRLGQTQVMRVLGKLATTQPELRERIVAALIARLEDFEQTHPELNAFLGLALRDAQVPEALPLLRRVHESRRVDESIYGDWEDIQKMMGVEPDLDDPLVQEARARRVERGGYHDLPPLGTVPSPSARSKAANSPKARKEKGKRKAAKATRKANKKRK